ADYQHQDADPVRVHAQRARQAVDEVGSGLADQAEETAQGFHQETDEVAQYLAQSFEEALGCHRSFLTLGSSWLGCVGPSRVPPVASECRVAMPLWLRFPAPLRALRQPW